MGLDIGDIIEQQVTNEQGKREYQLYIYVGEHTAMTVENEQIQRKIMNESPKNVPTRINNHLKSVYPSYPLDLIKDRTMSQEPGQKLRGATSEEFVNFIVFSQLVSPMKDRQSTRDETHVLDLQMFLYQLGSDGIKIAKDRERYVNIINGGSDSLATDSATFIKDTQVIGVKNIQTQRAPIIPMKKPRGNANNAIAATPEYFFSQINVRDNDKLWIIVSFKHDMPTLTYFLYLTKENLQKIKENTLVLRTNPQLQYRVDWVPKSTNVNNESNGFWSKIREITDEQLKMENIVYTVTHESKNSTAKL
ncbi:hypothetical protein Ddc_20023 [Ditylenchus destructor]|nr:hypothetical protein Ddc_20023 [Ditylenchus destructor]